MRDFATADAIQEELRQVAQSCGCYIFIDDRGSNRTFRFSFNPNDGRTTHGSQGDGGRSRRDELTRHDYVQEEGEGQLQLSAEAQAEVDALLLQRIVAKR